MNRLFRSLLIASVLTALVACGSDDVPLPPIPDISVDNPLPVVEAQIRDALQAVRDEPLNADKNGLLGMTLSAYGQTDKAQVFFQRAHRLAPKEFKWLYYQAATSHASGDAEQTVKFLERAIRIDPDYGPAKLRLAEIYLQNDRLDEAAANLKGLESSMGDEPRLQLVLGRLAHKKGDTTAARQYLEEAVELAPAAGEPLFALAQLLRDLGEKTEAAEAINHYDLIQSNRLHAHDPVLLEVSALNRSDLPHLTRGANYSGHGDITRAIESYTAALAVNPVSNGAHAALIRLYARNGEQEKAAQIYADARERGLADVDVLMAFAGARRADGDTDEALSLLAKALSFDPEQRVAWLAKAEMHYERREQSEAIESYRSYLDIEPINQRARWRLGVLLSVTGDQDAAERQLREALAQGGYLKADILRALANVMTAKDERGAARQHLQDARAIAAARSDLVLLSAIDKDLAGLGP